MFSRCRLLSIASLVLLAPPTQPNAQTAVTSPSSALFFEVASVRLSNTDPVPFDASNEPLSRFPTNHYYVRNLPLKYAIANAFGVDQRYIDGGPAWLDTQNYFIEAKVDGGQQLTRDQMAPLLQNLLAQRLGLKAHRESRLVAGYELVVAKGGPKLEPTKGEGRFVSIGPNGLSGAKNDAAAIAQSLSYAIHQPVVDKTGLTGSYDIKLSYAPTNNPNADSTSPDIFTAIQEQLGLKLEPTKVPVDYLIVDHIDRVPTEN